VEPGFSQDAKTVFMFVLCSKTKQKNAKGDNYDKKGIILEDELK